MDFATGNLFFYWYISRLFDQLLSCRISVRQIFYRKTFEFLCKHIQEYRYFSILFRELISESGYKQWMMKRKPAGQSATRTQVVFSHVQILVFFFKTFKSYSYDFFCRPNIPLTEPFPRYHLQNSCEETIKSC